MREKKETVQLGNIRVRLRLFLFSPLSCAAEQVQREIINSSESE